jgi:hypothetical protein
LCALFIPLMLFARTMASRNPQAHPAPPMPGFIMALYGLLAVGFIWIGFGSILARRWARAIALCMSAVGLCCGLIGCVAMVFILPHFGDLMAKSSQTSMPPGAILTAEIFIAVAAFVIYIIVPGALFLFYRSPNVKLTCEARDPVERWTDRCPLPVLALSLMMICGGTSLLLMAGSFRVFPFFGVFVSGGACVALMLLIGALFLYLAWGMYRLRLRAWWIALCAQVILLTSNLLTFWQGGFDTFYLKMGYDQGTAGSAGSMLGQPVFKWVMVASVFFWIGWLLWILRFFPKQEPTAAHQAGS